MNPATASAVVLAPSSSGSRGGPPREPESHRLARPQASLQEHQGHQRLRRAPGESLGQVQVGEREQQRKARQRPVAGAAEHVDHHIVPFEGRAGDQRAEA
ncbi:MAG: hypothetical protein KDH17_07180 [Rhodocyclaceae bacterium]|nr:hypothetical protein [Rhodocyclaceae bacterium]